MNLKSQTRNALDNNEEKQLDHPGTISEVYNGTANDESWRLEVCMCAGGCAEIPDMRKTLPVCAFGV